MASPGDPDEIKTFDSTMKTNHYEAEGTYTVELVGEQRRLRRRRRSDDYVNPEEHVEHSLLAFINHSKLCLVRHPLSDIYKLTRRGGCRALFSDN